LWRLVCLVVLLIVQFVDWRVERSELLLSRQRPVELCDLLVEFAEVVGGGSVFFDLDLALLVGEEVPQHSFDMVFCGGGGVTESGLQLLFLNLVSVVLKRVVKVFERDCICFE